MPFSICHLPLQELREARNGRYRISTASGSERGPINRLIDGSPLATARGTDMSASCTGRNFPSALILWRFANACTWRQAVQYGERQRPEHRSRHLLIDAQVADAISYPTSRVQPNPAGGSRWIIQS